MRTTIIGEQVGILNALDYEIATDLAERVIQRYTDEEIDAVYIVFNEFKSVIAQRLVVEKILPIEQIGEAEIAQAEGLDQEGKKR